MSQSMKLLASERRAVAPVLLIFVLRMVGLFMLLPVLALYAEQLERATPVLVGLAVGGYGISQAVLQLPFGWASDRFGRRPLLIIGLMLFATGSLIAFFSTHITGVVIGRIVQGAGAISAVLTALVGDHVEPQRRTRAMAFIGASIGMSFLLALLFGPVLSSLLGTGSLFLVAAGFALAALAITLWLPPDKPVVTTTPSLLRSLRAVLPHRRLWPLNVGILVLHMVLAMLFVALPFVLLNHLFIPGDEQWRVIGWMLLLSLPGTVLLIKLNERKDGQRKDAQATSVARPPYAVIALIGLSMFALSLRVTHITSVNTLIVMGAVFFSAFNFLEARLPAQVSLLAPEAQRGTAMGVYASCQFLGVFLGGLLGGWAMGSDMIQRTSVIEVVSESGPNPFWWPNSGPSFVFVLAAAGTVLWLVLARVFSSRV